MDLRWKPFVACLCMTLAFLAGCTADEDATTAPPSSRLPSSSAPVGGTTTPTPSRAPSHEPRFVGVPDEGPVPTFTMPPVLPKAQWSRVELAADMPAGTWLFGFVPFPPGHLTLEAEMPRQFRLIGEPNPAGAAARMVFAPFLVIDEKDGRIAEILNQEQDATYDGTGAPWTYEPTLAELVPFGETKYAGIAFMAAANTDWSLNVTLQAPWGGNGSVGVERLSWGRGFSATQLPAMTQSDPPSASATLDWEAAFDAGWMAVHASSSCYNPSPCADAALDESWTFTFPGGAFEKGFQRTGSGGTVPHGLFGSMSLPAGPLKVTGDVSGLTGPRTLRVFHAPVPADAWPFALTDATFDWEA